MRLCGRFQPVVRVRNGRKNEIICRLLMFPLTISRARGMRHSEDLLKKGRLMRVRWPKPEHGVSNAPGFDGASSHLPESGVDKLLPLFLAIQDEPVDAFWRAIQFAFIGQAVSQIFRHFDHGNVVRLVGIFRE